jgi:hypothetical protein
MVGTCLGQFRFESESIIAYEARACQTGNPAIRSAKEPLAFIVGCRTAKSLPGKGVTMVSLEIISAMPRLLSASLILGQAWDVADWHFLDRAALVRDVRWCG